MENVLQIALNKMEEKHSEIKLLQESYFIAKAMEEEVVEKENEIKKKILLQGNYVVCDEIWNLEKHRGLESRRITEPDNDYLIDEDIFINDYLEKCYSEYVKTGIDDKRGKEYIPSAEYHDLRIQTENQILKTIISLFEDTELYDNFVFMSKHWKYKEEILDLALKLK